LHIEKYAEKVLTKGTIVGGQINNIDEITNVLNELKNSLKLTYVKMSLPEEKAYLFPKAITVKDFPDAYGRDTKPRTFFAEVLT
jgi:Tfp pilus assembly PilM family ATPase